MKNNILFIFLIVACILNACTAIPSPGNNPTTSTTQTTVPPTSAEPTQPSTGASLEAERLAYLESFLSEDGYFMPIKDPDILSEFIEASGLPIIPYKKLASLGGFVCFSLSYPSQPDFSQAISYINYRYTIRDGYYEFQFNFSGPAYDMGDYRYPSLRGQLKDGLGEDAGILAHTESVEFETSVFFPNSYVGVIRDGVLYTYHQSLGIKGVGWQIDGLPYSISGLQEYYHSETSLAGKLLSPYEDTLAEGVAMFAELIGGTQIEPMAFPPAFAEEGEATAYIASEQSHMVPYAAIREIGAFEQLVLYRHNGSEYAYTLTDHGNSYQLTIDHDESRYISGAMRPLSLNEAATDMTCAQEIFHWQYSGGGIILRDNILYSYRPLDGENYMMGVDWEIDNVVYKLRIPMESFDITTASPFIQQLLSLDETEARATVQRIADAVGGEITELNCEVKKPGGTPPI